MRNFLRRVVTDDRGAVIIELALIAPILALCVAGIVDISNAFSRKLALEQGAQRAIEKIMQTTGEDSVEGTLKSEAVCQVNGVNVDGTCKTSPITSSNVTVTWRLECINKSSRTVTSSRTATSDTTFDELSCGTDEHEAKYIQVGVTDKYAPMFPLQFFGVNNNGDKNYHVSATAGMRTQ